MALRVTFADAEDSIGYTPTQEEEQDLEMALAEIALDGESTRDTWGRWFMEERAKFVCRYKRKVASEAVPLDNSILE